MPCVSQQWRVLAPVHCLPGPRVAAHACPLEVHTNTSHVCPDATPWSPSSQRQTGTPAENQVWTSRSGHPVSIRASQGVCVTSRPPAQHKDARVCWTHVRLQAHAVQLFQSSQDAELESAEEEGPHSAGRRALAASGGRGRPTNLGGCVCIRKRWRTNHYPHKIILRSVSLTYQSKVIPVLIPSMQASPGKKIRKPHSGEVRPLSPESVIPAAKRRQKNPGEVHHRP